MSVFHLPDLGEGLLDAEIHTWFVKVGDKVEIDQPMVAMETAKAVVDVPAPQSGVIVELCGNPGDIIKTGAPLVKFEDLKADNHALCEGRGSSAKSIVGHLEETGSYEEDTCIIGNEKSSPLHIRATPAVRLLAKQLQVDLKTIRGTGHKGLITKQDIYSQQLGFRRGAKERVEGVYIEYTTSNERVCNKAENHALCEGRGSSAKSIESAATISQELTEGFIPLKGVRRAMLQSMNISHKQVVPVTIYDEADIHAWPHDADITVRLLKAITKAAAQEPALNSWFDEKTAARKCFPNVNIGLAMDNQDGLFVPVINDVQQKKPKELRKIVDSLKQSLLKRSLSSEQFKGATFVLSNFGKFSGKFASPIIVPPTVAILGVGKTYEAVVAFNGKPAIHKLLPLSLSFDHRAITGGEATRFLGALMADLR